jgi:hypothetical protein
MKRFTGRALRDEALHGSYCWPETIKAEKQIRGFWGCVME